MRSISDYDRLLEDLHDLAVLAERRGETPVSMNEIYNK